MQRRMPTTWIAVTVETAAELRDSVESALLDLGAPGLQIEDDGERSRITAHFSAPAPLAALRTYCQGLAELHPQLAPPRITSGEVTDGGWAENWKQHFPALSIGDRLFVHPPWVKDVPVARVGVLLDPGMAFGTGHHASTHGCLALLERALTGRRAAQVLDLGCGSGILAIAAIKLGAARAAAIDIDPDACAVAQENAAINGVAAAIRIDTNLAAAPGPFDIVLANLFATQLVDFAPIIAARLAPGAVAIGAGILLGEAEMVRDAWQRVGLVADGDWTADGWIALAYRRPT